MFDRIGALRLVKVVLVLAVAIGSFRCSMFGSDCAGVSLRRLTPMDTVASADGNTRTIHIGESFVILYEEGETCGPTKESDYHAVPLTWTTSDSLIVRLGPAAGRVTGLTVGDARLTAPERPFAVTVHVR